MKVLLIANTDWYLFNFRLPLARAIRARGLEVVLVSPPGRYTSRLEQQGFRWIRLPLKRRSINPLSELVTLLHLVLIYFRERPDLVHHFTIKCVLYGSIAARLAGVKSVVNAFAGLGHVFNDDRFKTKVLRFFVKRICKPTLRGTQVIFQNPDDQRVFVLQGLVVETESHLIRGSGVDVDTFNPTIRRPSNAERRVLLASRLLWAKGLAEYVEAARAIHESMPCSQFLIAGETDPGNPAAVPQHVIDQWQTRRELKILGHRDDVVDLLRIVDVVALPSYYGEGVPRILIEAAAIGLPLVATDMPGCREIVRPGVNGLLVRPRDAGQLASAIRQLLVDDQLRLEMGKQSRELACKEFSENQVINSTLQVYQESLAQRNSTSRSSRTSFEVRCSGPLHSTSEQE
jgi:glycosyltransferase involved in cell wall biosynthesis